MLRGLDRIIITVAALALLVMGVVIVALVAGWNGGPVIIGLISTAQQATRIETGLLGLLGLAVGMYLLAVAWQRDERADSLRLETDGGDIRISLKAVESVVFEAAAEVDGVREVTARLGSRDGELVMDVAVHVSSDRAMPDVARDVQQQVATRINEVAGVPVARLDVHVQGVAKSRRHRVE